MGGVGERTDLFDKNLKFLLFVERPKRELNDEEEGEIKIIMPKEWDVKSKMIRVFFIGLSFLEKMFLYLD